ncbi:hypothetical protein B0T24DRAFT_703889 [Lasiosphaeria ovina]|uniref:Myb-like domain-containing protein n=1 Tax=Lasiosphaeria ovina TaxID=92902 RepID=A0AAE0KD05_9PEZI|nr:hypothetical protein B0T24DRAFT_703889 [Lasiosphaeria ovina]
MPPRNDDQITSDDVKAGNVKFSMSSWLVGRGPLVLRGPRPKPASKPARAVSVNPQVIKIIIENRITYTPDSRAVADESEDTGYVAGPTNSDSDSSNSDDEDEDSGDNKDVRIIIKRASKKANQGNDEAQIKKDCLKKSHKSSKSGKQPKVASASSQNENADGTSAKGDTIAESTGCRDSDDEARTPKETGGKATGGPVWSAADDAKVLSMKKGGSTWAEIGKSVKRGKKEVQKRHKVLTTAGNTLAANDIANDGNNELTEAREQAHHHEKSHWGKDKSSVCESVSEPSPTDDGQDDSAAYEQNLYLHEMHFFHLYREHIKEKDLVIPDDRLTESECNIIALLSARRRANFYLQLESEFFNITGRRIPAQYLKHKFDEKKSIIKNRDGR